MVLPHYDVCVCTMQVWNQQIHVQKLYIKISSCFNEFQLRLDFLQFNTFIILNTLWQLSSFENLTFEKKMFSILYIINLYSSYLFYDSNLQILKEIYIYIYIFYRIQNEAKLKSFSTECGCL